MSLAYADPEQQKPNKIFQRLKRRWNNTWRKHRNHKNHTGSRRKK